MTYRPMRIGPIDPDIIISVEKYKAFSLELQYHHQITWLTKNLSHAMRPYVKSVIKENFEAIEEIIEWIHKK